MGRFSRSPFSLHRVGGRRLLDLGVILGLPLVMAALGLIRCFAVRRHRRRVS